MTAARSAGPNLAAVDRDGDAYPAYRSPPHNVDAEVALLGAILVNNDAHGKVAGFLLPEHFYEPVHGRIYEAATRLVERGQLANPVTLATYFERDEALAEVGGAQYLARLAASAVTVINAEDYGRTIYDLALRRALIEVGEEVVNTAYDSSIDETATEQIEIAEQRLFGLAEQGQHEGSFRPFKSSLREAIGMAEAAYQRAGHVSGVATGLRDLDAKLGGFHRSDLIVLAGRPSMGKTALATNIAFNAATNYRADDDAQRAADGAVVGFFSLEMSAEQLATRLLAEQAHIPSERLRRGLVDRDQFVELVRRSQELERLPFFIDDTPALTIAALRTRARRLKRTHDLGLVVVDYLQLLRPSGRTRTDNRVQEISEITQGLKALAKELDVPVLALSQLSRAVEQREDKRPLLADLRESGTIEQDADVVMFVYREEYYLARTMPEEGTVDHAKWQEKMEQVHGKAEIIIGKQRHGPTGRVELQFQAEYTLFRDLERPG